ncbi:MAG: hypothetical protein EXR98_12560 [Gemmataceae bacterium]|nr:hypothetical protein [Gemmataceae bacterium]
MTSGTTDTWNQHTRQTLARYDEALLRRVAHKLCKPRNQWPVDEILERLVSALNNAAMIDRRLKELSADCRRILAVIGQSRQTRWPVGALVEMIVALGHEDGLAPIVTLLESGLLLPELFPLGTPPDQDKVSARARFRNFDGWLARSEPMPILLASPLVTKRVAGEDLGITCPQTKAPEAKATVHEADGFDWPVRVAVLWQQLLDAPLRRTQQGDYFKRDYDRLQGDPLLSAAPTDVLAPVPDPGFFTAALATAMGLVREEESELRAGDWPAVWKSTLPNLLLDAWTALSRIISWNPAIGHAPATSPGNPYPSAYLLAMLLLARLPENRWAAPQDIEDWVAARHPFWLGKNTDSLGIVTFLLGIAYSLRLLQATKGDSGWLIRLSPLGRWVMGLTDQLPTIASFKQTLLVQPNLEILAYRQGLTPELMATLSKIGTWKVLGPACTLQLEPHSVYRALEMGESQSSIVQVLEGHGMKAVPTAVLDSLKTWSSKRERLSVYPAGAIFEFASPDEMNDAIARGLPALRLTDRLAIVANESEIEYKHFRLTGTRDYTLPPEKCVDVEADGVTLSVDLARSDLLLETELQRFAEPIEKQGLPGRRYYSLTPGSIAAARQQGVTLSNLEVWFGQRTGLPISAAAFLLMTGPDAPPVELRRQIILHVASEHLADGLQQWPGTREIVKGRVGPTALVVPEEDVPLLTERLKELGVQARFEG